MSKLFFRSEAATESRLNDVAQTILGMAPVIAWNFDRPTYGKPLVTVESEDDTAIGLHKRKMTCRDGNMFHPRETVIHVALPMDYHNDPTPELTARRITLRRFGRPALVEVWPPEDTMRTLDITELEHVVSAAQVKIAEKATVAMSQPGFNSWQT